MVTAFFFIIAPVGGLGIAVFTWVLIVAAFAPVPNAFAGTVILKPAPMFVFVKKPPAFGVTVSCFSGRIVKPDIAASVISFPVALEEPTETESGPPSYP